MSTKPYGLAVKAAIFDEQGQCLLIRRSANNRSFVGCWEWPGGKVDEGEDFAAALHREVAEETGLTVELIGFAGATSFEMPDLSCVLVCMEARLISGDLKLSDEHDDFVWVSLKEIPLYKYPPRISDLMREYAARQAG